MFFNFKNKRIRRTEKRPFVWGIVRTDWSVIFPQLETKCLYFSFTILFPSSSLVEVLFTIYRHSLLVFSELLFTTQLTTSSPWLSCRKRASNTQKHTHNSDLFYVCLLCILFMALQFMWHVQYLLVLFMGIRFSWDVLASDSKYNLMMVQQLHFCHKPFSRPALTLFATILPVVALLFVVFSFSCVIFVIFRRCLWGFKRNLLLWT